MGGGLPAGVGVALRTCREGHRQDIVIFFYVPSLETLSRAEVNVEGGIRGMRWGVFTSVEARWFFRMLE